MNFPLAQWFDVTKPINKADADLAEAQMTLCALKDGLDPDSEEAKKHYHAMRSAVKRHNRKFQK